LGIDNIDPARLGLRIRDYDEDPSIHDGMQREKQALNHRHANGENGVSNGDSNGHTNGHEAATATTAGNAV
jgi:hypothetical protein